LQHHAAAFQLGDVKMKIGLFASLAIAVAAVGFTQTPAHAMTPPAKPHLASAVSQTTFWKDSKKSKHAHTLRKHRVAHAEKHLKKKH
jgi:hypothetical protein